MSTQRPVPLALTAHRLDAPLAQLVLDLVDDRADLALVAADARTKTSVRASCSLTSMPAIVVGELVLGGGGGCLGQVEGACRWRSRSS